MKGWVIGIDVGSLTTDAVIMDEDKRVLSFSIVDTGYNSTDAAREAMTVAAGRAGLELEDVSRLVATGYGRAAVPEANKRVTEIACHAAGAVYLFPDTEMVIDIGGQDSKVIKVGKDGRVQDFVMNDKCAAGTGRFLEVMSAKLKIPLDGMGDISISARGEAAISSVCTVFAESEVVSLVARNCPKEEIVKGIHRSVVNRVWAMTRQLRVSGGVTMTGGVAKNRGVVALMEERVGRRINVPDEPQIVGALGAALFALREK
ncbi:MAG: 2-hydroxyglutaryl-CoA dehydratase [Deltaproteobacteria bacterium CG_4_8_14_3_um_filter_51_11]|nr:2-hydroxyglutaryl-CoA dehydratase [bacterium]OIP40222.1 MAG: 2-hydroxyglutaryl-CoA dehydratase [Desulfobacteraceae bacterium CG2_30_51_40]PIP44799.1 MAG: 2-hydroxyglutaryl-CoA dehydratase [Deltaproteobacteria bacterium CG23_combo_of_CG06-09_8_20_14_all_51_20]PIW00439.1 MAG: 2-hydroxyglutaryl-CoA dehydratase [Deltaproteobacteria bacterium CG17_big_fil_post_rev_8_21_14_2_50_51_6]PIX18233.1 MAG: 2-hydroxyglutaryl-CoA dehydratase [Deltaproteobacteria bacterium CG_4_8_14_3_um_filter_51_11]PIY269